jgi:hypothetical protein
MIDPTHRANIAEGMKKRWSALPRPVYTCAKEDLAKVKNPVKSRFFKDREAEEEFLLANVGKNSQELREALSLHAGKEVSRMSAYNLTWKYRLSFKLPPVQRERPVNPGLSDASTLGPNRTIFMVGGVSGSGKSWVCKSLGDAVHYVEYDKTTDRITALQEATFQDKPIVFDPVTHLRQYINRNPAVTFRTAIILESDDVLLARLRGRGSLMMELTPGLKKRVKRNSRYVEDAEFSGTSDEVLAWLRQQLSSYV